MSRSRQIDRSPRRTIDPNLPVMTGLQDTRLVAVPSSPVWTEVQLAEARLQRLRDGWTIDVDFVALQEYAQRVGDAFALAIAATGLAIATGRRAAESLVEPA